MRQVMKAVFVLFIFVLTVQPQIGLADPGDSPCRNNPAYCR